MLHFLEEYRKLVEASERKLEDSAVTLSAMPPLEEVEVRVDEAEPEDDDGVRYSGKRPRGKWDGDSQVSHDPLLFLAGFLATGV